MSQRHSRRLSNVSYTRPSRRLSNVSYTPMSAFSAGARTPAKFDYDPKDIELHGLGIITAAIFLAGEMAGSGVLALPHAMIGTGYAGLLLILVFTANACYSGTRLGRCWVILEERYPAEFGGIIRDPYPTIGEKAIGAAGRILSLVCISFTLYGGGCVFIVLIAQLMGSILSTWLGVHLSLCVWMLVVACVLVPLTWMGTPKDFWPIAVGALVTTVTACALIVIQNFMDYSEMPEDAENEYPGMTLEGWFKAFGSVMFAFAGASTFPTIQADMKRKEKFSTSATIACAILFFIYFPMAFAGYFAYGKGCEANVVLSISDGYLRLVVEVMLLLHLVAAYPIITNPPAQFFEHILSIPPEFGWKRCVFRTFSVFFLLFVAETIPSFGSILDLVGASTVTLLTFVFPPLFYMKLCDDSKRNREWKQWTLPIWERTYCWVLIVLGFVGGCIATYYAFMGIVSTSFTMPCYLQEGNITVATGGGH